MGRLRKLWLVGLLFWGTGAFASMNDGRPPTIADAHEYLRDAFTRYAIGYVLWHGPRHRDFYRGWSVYYGGNGCASEFGGADPSTRIFAVDWSLISSVQTSGSQAVFVTGQLHRPVSLADRPNYANFHLNMSDPALARSVARAMEFLRASCTRRSKFDG